jgi:hypothetical protein
MKMHVYEVRPGKDHRGVDLISGALPFGRLWYGEPSARGVPLIWKNTQRLDTTNRRNHPSFQLFSGTSFRRFRRMRCEMDPREAIALRETRFAVRKNNCVVCAIKRQSRRP